MGSITLLTICRTLGPPSLIIILPSIKSNNVDGSLHHAQAVGIEQADIHNVKSEAGLDASWPHMVDLGLQQHRAGKR